MNKLLLVVNAKDEKKKSRRSPVKQGIRGKKYERSKRPTKGRCNRVKESIQIPANSPLVEKKTFYNYIPPAQIMCWMPVLKGQGGC